MKRAQHIDFTGLGREGRSPTEASVGSGDRQDRVCGRVFEKQAGSERLLEGGPAKVEQRFQRGSAGVREDGLKSFSHTLPGLAFERLSVGFFRKSVNDSIWIRRAAHDTQISLNWLHGPLAKAVFLTEGLRAGGCRVTRPAWTTTLHRFTFIAFHLHLSHPHQMSIPHNLLPLKLPLPYLRKTMNLAHFLFVIKYFSCCHNRYAPEDNIDRAEVHLDRVSPPCV